MRKERVSTGMMLAAAAIVACAFVPQVGAGERLDAIKESGVLRIAGVVYEPLMIRKADGSFQGLDVDILNKFAEKLGVRAEVVDAGWDTAVAGVTTGKWDVVPAICITAKRIEVVDFTEPYIDLGGAFIVAADNPKNFQTVADLNKPDVVFADVAGGWGEDFARKAAPEAQHKLFPQATDADITQEVLSGRADAAVMNTPITTGLVKKQFGDRIRFIPGWDQPLDIDSCPVGYALPKGDVEMKALFDAELAALKEAGTFQAILDEWVTSAPANN